MIYFNSVNIKKHTETGMELIDGILVFRLDNNEEEVLWEVGRLKLGE